MDPPTEFDIAVDHGDTLSDPVMREGSLALNQLLCLCVCVCVFVILLHWLYRRFVLRLCAVVGSGEGSIAG